MDRINVKFFILLLVMILLIPLNSFAEVIHKKDTASITSDLLKDKTNQVESFIKKQMELGKIPGLSVVIVKDDKVVYKNNFGYSNLNTKQQVTSDTLFQLGSTSKAFTALGILQLEDRGLIHLNDPVKKYLPWFDVVYKKDHKGEKTNTTVDITLQQLLNHTSGIPYKASGDIPIREDKDALEETVKALVGKELDKYPGEEFLYNSLNYDILGLIIQKVSGISFEEYINNNILKPMALKNTYLFRKDAPYWQISKGYKIGFLKPREFEAPMYRGNTPAAYYITNIEDMSKWLKIQLGTVDLVDFNKQLIVKSHLPDRSVPPYQDGSSYADGWHVYQDGTGEILHNGSNPNFSSFIVFRPEDKIGVAILANMNSSYTQVIGQGVIDIIQNKVPKETNGDKYISVDNMSVAIIFIAVIFSIAILCLIITSFLEIFKRKRSFHGKTRKVFIRIPFLLIFVSGFAYCLYIIKDVLFYGLSWNYIKVWAPESFMIAIIALFFVVVIFCIYYTIITNFLKIRK